MRKAIAITIVVAIMLGLSPALMAEEQAKPVQDEAKTVVVKGEGVIFQNDKAHAKEKAIEAALRNAVEQVVGTYIKSSTLVQNYVTVDDKILSQSKGYVKTWKELSSKTDNGVVVVEIEATVAAARLKGALDGLDWALAKKEFPRVMLLLAEQNVGQTGFSYWWGTTTSVVSLGQVENTLVDELGKKGFMFVDPQVLSGKIKMKDAYKVSSANAGITDQAAREIASLTDAQIVIVGTAVATDAGPVMEGSKMHSGQADVTVRAINTDNGEIVATSSKHAADAHVSATTAGNKALIKAAGMVSEDIAAKLAEKWMSSTATITIELAGIATYKMFDDFKATLTHEIRGVKGVHDRRMVKDTAMLDVYSDTKASMLVKEMQGKTFPGFKLRVDEVTPNKIKLTLVK